MSRYQHIQLQVEAIFREARMLSIHTRRRYREACLRFAAWAAEHTRMSSLSDLTADDVRAYCEALRAQGVADRTIRTDLAGLGFAHSMLYLMGKARWQGKLPTPTELGLPPRQPVPDRRWTKRDLEAMVAKALELGHERYADMMQLAWELGLRIHEVVRIVRAQCEPHALKRGTFPTLGKGGKRREVPLTPKAREILEKYRRRTPRGKMIFVGDGETAGQVIHGLQRFILAHRPEPEPGQSPLTFHGLRYSYAQRQDREMAQAGKPKAQREKEISRRLGHNRPEVTRTYVRD